MRKLGFKIRTSIALSFLIIVPWTTVSIMFVWVTRLHQVPVYEYQDAREIDELSRSLDAYRARYGSYPPDFATGNPRQEIDEHLRSIFPNRDAQLDLPAGIDQLGPDKALAFWLKGFFVNNSRFPLTGKISLGQDPDTDQEILVDLVGQTILAKVYNAGSVEYITTNGLVTTSNRQGKQASEGLLAELERRSPESLAALIERKPLFRFEPQRLSKRNTYRPRCSDAPLVYFNSQHYSLAEFRGLTAWGVAKPYRSISGQRTDFLEPSRFQIICAGRDAVFAVAANLADSIYLDGSFLDGHGDNFTNFSPRPLGTRGLTAHHRRAVTARNLSLVVACICATLYPLVVSLGRKQNGIVILASITRRQFAAGCSDSWKRRLDRQRERNRVRALDRLRTPKVP